MISDYKFTLSAIAIVAAFMWLDFCQWRAVHPTVPAACWFTDSKRQSP